MQPLAEFGHRHDARLAHLDRPDVRQHVATEAARAQPERGGGAIHRQGERRHVNRQPRIRHADSIPSEPDGLDKTMLDLKDSNQGSEDSNPRPSIFGFGVHVRDPRAR